MKSVFSTSNGQMISIRRTNMRLLRVLFVTVLLAMMWQSVPTIAMAGEGGRNACRRGDRISIRDMDLSPDPIIEGQRIRGWKVRIQLEGNRECDTEIAIREGGDTVGRERTYRLRPGINEVEIQPAERYRFHGREHCFNVVVDLEGTRREVDANRRFCAYQKASWSMREAGDRERSFR
jgi:hypothetical protein